MWFVPLVYVQGNELSPLEGAIPGSREGDLHLIFFFLGDSKLGAFNATKKYTQL